MMISTVCGALAVRVAFGQVQLTVPSVLSDGLYNVGVRFEHAGVVPPSNLKVTRALVMSPRAPSAASRTSALSGMFAVVPFGGV